VFAALPEGVETSSIYSLVASNPMLCPKLATETIHDQSQTGSTTSDPVATPQVLYSQRLAVACCSQSCVSLWKQPGSVRTWQIDKATSQTSLASGTSSIGPVMAQWCHENHHLVTLSVSAHKLVCWEVAGVACSYIVCHASPCCADQLASQSMLCAFYCLKSV
jgi:hypothetical protein